MTITYHVLPSGLITDPMSRLFRHLVTLPLPYLSLCLVVVDGRSHGGWLSGHRIGNPAGRKNDRS
jgi:hypothetical protein